LDARALEAKALQRPLRDDVLRTFNAATVPISSNPISREYPATSAARIAANRLWTRCSATGPHQWQKHQSIFGVPAATKFAAAVAQIVPGLASSRQSLYKYLL